VSSQLDTAAVQVGAVPPAGYLLPIAATNLLILAQEHGWRTAVQWATDTAGHPFAQIEVAHRPTDGAGWHYTLTWHNRDLPPGQVRLWGRILASTPEHPAWHHAPSLRAVRAAITATATKTAAA
jgi:hypothetical protein